MRLLSRIQLTAIAAFLALSCTACGGNGTSGAGGSGTVDTSPCGAADPFCHSFAGKHWSDEKTDVTFAEATAYCQDLGGHLPSISDLRELFVDCPVTEPGGACGVTETCASEACVTEGCVGCGDGGLNVFKNENPFWSSTANTDVPGERFIAIYRYSGVDSIVETKAVSAYCCVQP